MEGSIKVTPEKLVSTATEFSGSAKTIGNLTQEMLNKIGGLKTSWVGDAATTYTTKFNGLQGDMQKLVRMIQEHSKDLTEMAREYETAENTNVESSSSLSTDIIS